MAEAVQRKVIGDTNALAFDMTWSSVEPEAARGLGWGSVILWFAGTRLWTSSAQQQGGPVWWTWIDLVEHLARGWGHLKYEENAPFGLVTDDPEKLRQRTLLRSVAGQSAIVVEDAVHAFQQRHDLAAGLKGINLPPLWLLREGNSMRLRAAGRDASRPLEDVLKILEAFVDTVRARECHAPRALSAFAAWDNREPSQNRIRIWRTGLNDQEIRDWRPSGESSETWHTLLDSDSSFQAAARLSQPLREDTRMAILAAILGLPKPSSVSTSLNELSAAARAVRDAVARQKPYEQGYSLALWLRAQLNLGDKPVNPDAIFETWDVTLKDLPRLESSLDAVACWGPERAITVLVNPAGLHTSSPPGRRATLAHEIAHLLFDRDLQLPAAEVFGGSTPVHLEKRARAFAAELLLPRDVAARAIARAASLDAAISSLDRYQVSRELIGWQIKNGMGWGALDSMERSRVSSWLNSPVSASSHSQRPRSRSNR